MVGGRWCLGLITALVVSSFTAGVLAPGLQADSLPEHFVHPGTGGDARELDPAKTYGAVLQLIKEHYHGPRPTPSDRLLTEAAVRGMLGALDDPYTRYFNREEYRALLRESSEEPGDIGARLESGPGGKGYPRVRKLLPESAAGKAGVREGDRIVRIDGHPVPGLTASEAERRLRGKTGTPVRLDLLRTTGRPIHHVTVTRASAEVETVRYSLVGGEGGRPGEIGYVTLAQFDTQAGTKVEHALREMQDRGMKGVILDLRGNPGGLLDSAVDIASLLLPTNRDVVTIVDASGTRETLRTDGRKFLGSWPLVILANGTSASASEIVAGAMQDHRAGLVVGRTTLGKGLVQTPVLLDDGSACMMTTARYLTPNGRDINRSRKQRGGVQPDVTVEEPEKLFRSGVDAQLRKAVEILRAQIVHHGPLPANGDFPGGSTTHQRRRRS